MTILDGTVAATTAAAPLSATSQFARQVAIQNQGTDTVVVGNATSQSVQLNAGDFYTIEAPHGERFNVADIYVAAGATTATVGWNGIGD